MVGGGFGWRNTTNPKHIFLCSACQPHDGRSYSRAVGYSRGLPPLQTGQGSHEREITNIGAGNNFGNNRTIVLIYFLKIIYQYRIVRTVY